METLKDATKDFILYCCHEKKLSEKTQKFYNIDLVQFNQFLVKENLPLNIGLIDKNSLRKYVHSLSEFKPKTIKRKVASLKTFFNFMEFEDKILVNPFRKTRINIKEPKVLPVVMTISEVQKIFKCVYANRSDKKLTQFKSFESIRNMAVIELLFATGIRVSELSNLRQDNIDIEVGFIKVKGKGNKERMIQICNSETILALKEYSDIAKDYRNSSINSFFVNRLGLQFSEQSVRAIVKKITTLAEIKKRITPHIFRHSVATLLLEEGVDIKYIQTILGHSSIMTTQIYTHVNGEKQKAILTDKHPRKNFTMCG